MPVTASRLMAKLEEYGELHVFLDSGEEFHLHKHDVHEGEHDTVIVDSRLGKWRFPVSKVESWEVPDSHKES